MLVSCRIPNFAPSRNGFRFANSFPTGQPVILATTPFGDIRAGDASRGLCGGMIFTAMDFYLHGVGTLPGEFSPDLYRYFCSRLMASWNLPFGGLKYYDWQTRPGTTRTLGGVRLRSGVSYLTIVEEWPRVRSILESGLPAALGLVNVRGCNPFKLGHNHQVLAYGYDLDAATDDLTLHIYDPNYPGDDNCTLRVNLREPDLERPVFHSCEGATVRGFFLTEYRRPLQPPGL